MPANPKYLTTNLGHRVAKISAAILGGLMVSSTTLLAIAVWLKEPKTIFNTFSYAFHLEWCTLFILAFLFKNGYKCWAVYGGITLLLLAIYWTGTFYNTLSV